VILIGNTWDPAHASPFRTTELQEMVEAATVDAPADCNPVSVIILNIRSGIMVLVWLPVS
jgi:hypothetical protein